MFGPKEYDLIMKSAEAQIKELRIKRDCYDCKHGLVEVICSSCVLEILKTAKEELCSCHKYDKNDNVKCRICDILGFKENHNGISSCGAGISDEATHAFKEGICPDCGGEIKIRNPTGKCDHLKYPEYKEEKG